MIFNNENPEELKMKKIYGLFLCLVYIITGLQT